MSCLSQQTAPIVPRVPLFEDLPPYLRDRMSNAEKPCCLLWRMKLVTKADGSTRWTKVPLSASGRGEKWGEAIDRGTYSRIKSLAASYGVGHGLGVALGEFAATEGEFLCGLDVDTCIDPLTGAFAPWAASGTVLFPTYGEVSPSGTGVKLFFRMTRADAEKADSLLAEIRAKYAGNANVFPQKGAVPTAEEHLPAFEVYMHRRWFAVTGDKWGDAEDVALIGFEVLENFILNVAMPFAGKLTKEQDRARKKGEKKGTASKTNSAAKGSQRSSTANGAAGYSTTDKPTNWGKRHISSLSREEIVSRLGGDDNGLWINCPGPGHSAVDRTLGVILDPADPKGFRINSLAGDDRTLCEELVMCKLGLSRSARPAPRTPEEECEAKERKATQEAESEVLVAKKRDASVAIWGKAQPDDPRVGAYLDQCRGGLLTPPFAFKTSRNYVDKKGEICCWTDKGNAKFNILAQIRDFETGEPIGLHVTVVARVRDDEALIRNIKSEDGSSVRFTCGSGTGFIELMAGGLGTRTLFCAEGNETALSLLQLNLGYADPAVRALVAAGNFSKMPPAGKDFDTIVVAADIEKSGAGLKAAQQLAKIQRAHGVRLVLVVPILPAGVTKRDCNDIALDCRAEDRAPEEGRDYELQVIEPITVGVDDDGLGDYDAAFRDANSFSDDDPHDTPDPNSLDAAIRELNERFFFAPDGGKAWVVEKSFKQGIGTVYIWHAPYAFEQMFMNRTFPEPSAKSGSKKAKKVGLGTLWLRSPKRRQYLGGAQFDPQNALEPDIFNTWEGFAYEPKRGDWSKNRHFLHDVICSGSDEHFGYLLKWLARAVQFPWLQGEVAVILQSEEGTGKGFFVRAFMKLFGPHVRHVSDAAGITGKFNEHLEHTVVLFGDEAHFAGNKQDEGRLLATISEPTLDIEPKGRGRRRVRNCLHVLMASNRNWVVAASAKARRWFVVNVSDTQRRNHTFFAELMQELESGGYEAMLWELLHEVDLAGFHPVNFPATEALRDQKLQSLTGMDRWWFDSLWRGHIMPSKYSFEGLEQWHELVTRHFAEDAYTAAERSHGNTRFVTNAHALGVFLNGKVCQATKKDVQTAGKAVDGEILKTERVSQMVGNVPSVIERKTPVLRFNEKRTTGYNLGTLAKARADFCAAYEIGIDWPPEASEEEEGAQENLDDLPF